MCVDILIVFSCSFLGSPIGQRPDQVVITKMKFDLRPGVTCDDDVFILMLECYSTSVFFFSQQQLFFSSFNKTFVKNDTYFVRSLLIH